MRDDYWKSDRSNKLKPKRAVSDMQVRKRLECALALVPPKGQPFTSEVRQRMSLILKRAIKVLERREQKLAEWKNSQ